MKVLELRKTGLRLGPFRAFWAVVCEPLVNFTQCRHRTHLTHIDRMTGSLEDIEHSKGMAPPLSPTQLQGRL